MNKTRRWWRKALSLKLLKNQIILWFVTVIVLLLAVVAGFTLFTLRPYLYDTRVRQLQKNVDLLSWELDNQRKKLQDYSVNIMADSTIQSFLLGHLEDISGLSNQLRLLMMRYTEYDRSIQGVYMADGNGELYGNFVTAQVQSLIYDTLEDALASDGHAIWFTPASGDTLVMYRAIHDTTHDLTHTIGALYLMIDMRSFTEVCDRFLDSNVSYRLEDGALILGNELPENQQQFFVCTSMRDGWTLSAWLSRDEVYAPAKAILNMLAYCLASTLIAGIALTVFISGRLTGPLRELRHAMVRAGGGDLNANVHVRRKDEIALLARTYNRMLADTKEYIRENERNQRRQKELELKTLQYQINPHFLYNTLDSIYMMARRSGNGEIEDMVTSLSTLFRLSLAHGQDFVTLEHEIRYITCYLQIQRIRFPLDFTWHTTVPDELSHCRVMKFLLQPLVENSLNHGLRNKPGGGQICVSARREGDELILVVADDGMGMTEEQLHALLELINRTDMEENRDPFAGGVGVRNVHQRLLLSYGHGLEIESDWEEGTTVTIRIPFQNDEESKEEFL